MIRYYHIIILQIVLFAGNFPLADAQEKWNFREITVDDGLSANNAKCVFQDSFGFIWIGTNTGLNRYDGYEFKTFNNLPGDSLTISNSAITAIIEDQEKNLWIGTIHGLNVYYRKTGRFKSYLHDPNDTGSISNNRITCLLNDNEGNILVGTRNGINKIKKINNEIYFQKFFPEINSEDPATEYEISFLFQDSKSRIWTAIRGHGLIHFMPKENKFTYYRHDPSNHFSISGDNIDCIEESKKGELWMYDRYSGINKFIPETGMFYNYGNSHSMKKVLEPLDRVLTIEKAHDGNIWFGTINTFYVYDQENNEIIYSGESNAIPGYKPIKDQVLYLFEDRTGIIWICYGDVGIDVYDPNQDKFSKWYIPFNIKDQYRDYITSMIYLNEKDIWFGTWEGGLIHTNIKGDIYKRYINTSTLPQLSNNNIISITQDNKGKIWIGTENGLNVFDPVTEEIIRHYFSDPKNNKSLKNNYIINLYRDNDNLIWIITEEGLNIIDPVSGRFINDSILNLSGLKKTRDIYHDHEGDYWFATEDGLVKYSKQENELRYFHTDPSDPEMLCSNHVTSIFQSSDGIYWFGTKNGISRYNKTKDNFKNYFEKDGLISNEILMCQEDADGNIWILTPLGISKFEPQTETFINYDKKYGLKRKSFYIYECYDDEFVITNEKGFYKFPPNDIQSNSIVPPIVFTEFYLNGKKVPAGQPPFKNTSLLYTDEIFLNYNERSFGISFSALNYTSTEKNQYAYKLEGYHDKWQYLGTRREIDLLNIKPGRYILRVIGSNNDNIWNDTGRSIKLNILPPWWQTWWAFLIYGIIIFGILAAYRFFAIHSERIRNQVEIEKIKAQKMHEIDEMKIAFFSNISHELRTPLTLMLGPLNNYFQEPDKGLPHNKISLLYRNAKRLHNLIDQLLDLRKIDVGKLHLNVIKGDLVKFIKDLLPSYESYANQLNIHFTFHFSESTKNCFYDQDKIEKIISNLISNALKYTPENGSIVFTLDFLNRETASKMIHYPDPGYHMIDKAELIPEGELFSLITVSDTGKGIKQNELNLIFNRFYQSPQGKSNFSSGSGIGLSLIKDLINILNGHMFLKSEQGKGTTFKILLPADRKSFLDSEVSTQDHEELYLSKSSEYTTGHYTQNLSKYESNSEHPAKKDTTILVVEDNEDLIKYLEEFLIKKYSVIMAGNGNEGLEIALNEKIDLILSDLMMPDMDGIEFCKRIKNDERTSHIPFIMLTARESIDSELEGLESGSDDYIIKPFNDAILLTKIRNILNSRQELREKFIGDLNIIPEGVKLANRDKDFLEKIIQIVESDISNTEFDKDDFYRQIGMSRTQVYRKLNSLTNQSVNEFIRNIRLKKAAEVLKCSSNISISELAYMVGFSNPNYFTRVFREYFDITPTQYSNKFFRVANKD